MEKKSSTNGTGKNGCLFGKKINLDPHLIPSSNIDLSGYKS